MDILCRLCGEMTLSHELKCTINDKNENIEQKLFDCCRWSQYQNDENLPENICISCFECLEQSWRFCEKVSSTQNKLREFFIDVKLQKSDSINNIETHLEDEYIADHESTFHDFGTTVWCDDGEYLDDNIKQEPMTVLEIDAEAEMSERKIELMADSEGVQPILSVEVLDNQQKVDSRRMRAENRDNRKNKIPPHNEEEIIPSKISFPKCIEQHERNPDGTIDSKAIARLKLCDWTIYQPQCHVCNVCCTNLYELRTHYKKQHSHVPLRYKCWLCTGNRNFSKRQILNQHVIRYHCPYLAHCCKRCNVFYWDANILKSHQLERKCNDRSHKLLPVICPYCADIFSNEYNYRSHLNYKHVKMISPHLRNVFECFLCKLSFDKRSKCKEHMKKHTGRNVVKCDHCNLTITKKYLKQHYRTHLNLKPFTCSFCGKGFKFNAKLKNHERIHTGARPFKCKAEGCNYSTGDGGNIYKHMRLKHNMVFPRK